MTNTILVVDDSPVDRRLAAGLLRSMPDCHVELAADGKEALEHIGLSPPDIVVADLVMPEMDGLELVRTVRARHPRIPVVLMTAYGNESTAVEALEAGASSYVPKAQQAERLTETVGRVLARVHADRVQEQLASCLSEMYCSYSLDNDPSLITALVDKLQRVLAGVELGDAIERIRVCVALEEAVLNAMYHGNLEISEEELAQSRVVFGRTSLASLVEQRRGAPRFRDRRVLVDAHISRESARFVVRDDGLGFNPSRMSRKGISDYFERGHRRGLMLMRSLMDEVSFNDKGNTVTLVKLGS